MYFNYVACFLALFAGCVTAQSESFISSFVDRLADPSTADCHTKCTKYQGLRANCKAPHCGCNDPFLQTYGNCLLCQTNTPQDAAAVQFLLDTEMNQCRIEGFNVQFQLDLPPEAAAIVRKVNRDSASLRRSQTAFLALQVVGGHIGMLVILTCAIFTVKVRRHPTFLNFCITWIFSSVAFSIMLYRGTDGNTVFNSLGKVQPNECLAQTALTEGALVMTACSTLALIIQLWLGLGVTIHGDPAHGHKQRWWTTGALVLAPYIFFIAFALPSVFVGTKNVVVQGAKLESAIPTNFYCAVIKMNPFLQGVYGVTLGLMLVAMVFDVLIMRVLYKHWQDFRHLPMNSVFSLSCLLRVMAFSVYRIAMAIAYVVVIAKPPAVDSAGKDDYFAILFSVPIWVDLLQAATPLVAVLILGINEDAINYVLMSWRRTSKVHLTKIKNIDTANNDAGNGKAIRVLEADVTV